MLILCLTSVNEYRTGADSGLLDEWLALLAEKDTSALAKLYRAVSAPVYGFALSVLKNTQDAEDVLHDCLLCVYSAAADYRSAGKPLAWIMTIARNLCLQRLRERKRKSDIPEEDWQPYLESRDKVSPEDRMVLSECMNRLSDEEREIVVLHAVAGFRHREIAEIMSLPLPTVLSKYNRALKKLKKILTGSGKGEPR